VEPARTPFSAQDLIKVSIQKLQRNNISDENYRPSGSRFGLVAYVGLTKKNCNPMTDLRVLLDLDPIF
jgi:hypothetical protein